MINAIRTDLRKTLFSVKFLLSAIILLALILSSSCVLIDSTLPQYSIAEFIFKTDRTLWLSETAYDCTSIFSDGFSNQWIGIFIPFLVAFPCIPIFCDEYNSNCWRHSVERLGLKKYIISKFFCIAIVSVCLIFICYGIFAIICFGVFPFPDEYPKDPELTGLADFWGFNRAFESDSILLFVAGRFVIVTSITVLGGLFCLIVSAMSMNKYVSMGIPVLIYFFFAQVCVSIVSNGEMEDLKFYFLDNRERFRALEAWFDGYTGYPLWSYFVYFIVACAVMFVAYYGVMKRRLMQ